MSWFECKVTYEKEMEDSGKTQKVHEYYLVDALTFTEAEERISEEMESRGPFRLDTVKKVNYSETFFNNGQLFYKAKVGFIQLDEKNGVEKKKYTYMLVQANDFRDALEELEKQMKTTLADWTVASIQETQLVDAFQYEPEDAAPATTTDAAKPLEA